MNIREAATGDKQVLLELIEEFEASLPPLPYPDDTPEEDWERIAKRIGEGVVLIAEQDGRALGFVDAEFEKGAVVVVDVYVRKEAQRQGIATALLEQVAAAARERGLEHMKLEVDSRNNGALRFYERLGFEEGAKVLRVALSSLRTGDDGGETVGAVHVQTDDVAAVERVLEQYLPRLARDASSRTEATGGWVAVRVEPFTHDVVRKLGQELSYRFGVTVVLALEDGAVVRFVVHEQGRMVDEYLSVPEHYGPLPPGDVLALRANATVVARLTGADPGRVRTVARTAETGVVLPPPRELYEQVAATLGLQP
jgi:ribosomal protein S18 acetylase RimI-like enzyme